MLDALPLGNISRGEREALARAALLKWRDPVAYARDVLRTQTWSGQQTLLRSVATNPRVAIRSGHKIGKSTAFAILALWWVATRPRARVVLTAASYRQVEGILWKEI